MLSQDQIKERLFNYVSQHPGCTTVELALNSDVIHDDHALEIPDSLERWVDDKELIEVTYLLFTKPTQPKTIYFPKDSNIEVARTEEGIEILRHGERHLLLPERTLVTVAGQ